jgi:hypothetical protein
MKRILFVVLVLFSGAALAQSLSWGVAGQTRSYSSSSGSAVMIAGGELGGTGTSTVTATNTGSSSVSMPPLGARLVGGTALIDVGSGLSNNTTTVTGEVTAGPGSLGGYLGSGVGASTSQIGQFYLLTTAGPIPTPPVIISPLPTLPTLPTPNWPTPF